MMTPARPAANTEADRRFTLVQAFQAKYGRWPTEVEIGWLYTAKPLEIAERMRALGTRDPSFGADKGASRHVTMRPVYTAAFQRVYGRAPSPAELEAVMSVGSHESGYGSATYPGGRGPGSHNHGAVQASKPLPNGTCPVGSFLSEDSSPQASGPSKKYAICFKSYATDEDGAADVIKYVGKRPLDLMKQWGNSLAAFAAGMYLNGYFESFNAPDKVLSDPALKKVHAGLVKIGTKQSAVKDKDKLSDPQRAGRVLMYAIGLNKSADAAASAAGGKRATVLTVGNKSMVAIAATIAAVLAAAGGGVYLATHHPAEGGA